KGIKHFVDTTGVRAERGLTEEEVEEIEEEEKSLPSFIQPDDALHRMGSDMATRNSVAGDEMRRFVSEMLATLTLDQDAPQAVVEAMSTLIQEKEELRRIVAVLSKHPGRRHESP